MTFNEPFDRSSIKFEKLGGKLIFNIDQLCLYLTSSNPSNYLNDLLSDDAIHNLHLAKMNTDTITIPAVRESIDHMYLVNCRADEIVINQPVKMLHLQDVRADTLDLASQDYIDTLEFSYMYAPLSVIGRIKKLVIREQAMKQLDITAIDFEELQITADHTIKLDRLKQIENQLTNRLTSLMVITGFDYPLDFSIFEHLDELTIKQKYDRIYDHISLTFADQLNSVHLMQLQAKELDLSGDCTRFMSSCYVDGEVRPANEIFLTAYHNYTFGKFTSQFTDHYDLMYNKQPDTGMYTRLGLI